VCDQFVTITTELVEGLRVRRSPGSYVSVLLSAVPRAENT
jgi:hypothetical protein